MMLRLFILLSMTALNALWVYSLAAQQAEIPLTPRPHMNAETLALYNRIRTAPGWLAGTGAFVERNPATQRFIPADCGRETRRWKELYGCMPACYEWEVAERADPTYHRDWAGARAWSDQGGVPWFMCSLKNFTAPHGPRRQGSCNDRSGWLDPVLPGGPHHDGFISYMTQLAKELKAFGRPCVFRPFHEMNGRWFWWGGQPDKLKQIWRFTFDLFRREGVDNLIWCWAASGDSDAVAFYPGDDVVDIIGTDQYFDGPALPDKVHATLNDLVKIGKDKPIFLAELGPMARADFWTNAPAEFKAIPRLRGFNVWFARGWRPWGGDPERGSMIDGTSPPDVMSAFKAFLANPQTITLERFTASKRSAQ